MKFTFFRKNKAVQIKSRIHFADNESINQLNEEFKQLAKRSLRLPVKQYYL